MGRGEMERERNRLAREEASLRMAVEQMTKDVAHLRENITQLGRLSILWRIDSFGIYSIVLATCSSSFLCLLTHLLPPSLSYPTAEAGVGVQGEVSKLSRGTVLLSAHSHLCQETTRALQEFTRRIRARAELFNRSV